MICQLWSRGYIWVFEFLKLKHVMDKYCNKLVESWWLVRCQNIICKLYVRLFYRSFVVHIRCELKLVFQLWLSVNKKAGGVVYHFLVCNFKSSSLLRVLGRRGGTTTARSSGEVFNWDINSLSWALLCSLPSSGSVMDLWRITNYIGSITQTERQNVENKFDSLCWRQNIIRISKWILKTISNNLKSESLKF